MKKHQQTKGPSQRQLRAAELLRHAIAEIFALEDIEDDMLKGEILNVAEVRLSPDLKHATAFVASLSEKENDDIAQALNKHQRFFRGALAQKVELKYVPEIVFRGDFSTETAGRIDELLRSPDVARDLG